MPQLLNNPLLLEVGQALATLLLFIGLAWLTHFVLHRISQQIAKRKATSPLVRLLQSVARPAFVLVLLSGFILAVRSLTYFAGWQETLNQINLALIIILISYSLGQVVHILLSWYAETIATHTATPLDDTFIPLLRRVSLLAIYALGGLALLDLLGISITPMLTGLGLGGLAVALALQPTLASFFAGLQVITDRVVNLGDYVELEGGVRGYVTEIGWRSTRIRTPYENLVVIPNSRLVETIITNYDTPHQEVAVIVEAGVSYSSDLAQVEQIARQVAAEVIADLPEAAKKFEAWFGFDEFGDSNINFWVWLYATDYIATFKVKSELIRRLHARFRQEGIEINYPVRKLVGSQEQPSLRPGRSPNIN